MSKDLTIVLQDYIVHHIKTNDVLIQTNDGDYAYHVKTERIPLIRCGECKHWERLNYEAPKEGWCDDQMPYSDGRWVDADDFCSYGERKHDE